MSVWFNLTTLPFTPYDAKVVCINAKQILMKEEAEEQEKNKKK